MVYFSKYRLDQVLVRRKLAPTRSQAESYIRLGKVEVDGQVATKPGQMVSEEAKIKLTAKEQYVSRAGLKLASVAKLLGLDFKNKVVLDVGSSTGGFTDYALQHGAQKVIAVDVGTNQLHPSLHSHPKIELHEQTDIREVGLWSTDYDREKQQSIPKSKIHILDSVPDIILMDLSFVSLRKILPHILTLSGRGTLIVAMFKPQFEAGASSKHKGVIKNERMRRDIMKDFENWTRQLFFIQNKADSDVSGTKGNQERFYLLRKLSNVSN